MMHINKLIRTSSAGSDQMSPSGSIGQTLPPRGRDKSGPYALSIASLGLADVSGLFG